MNSILKFILFVGIAYISGIIFETFLKVELFIGIDSLVLLVIYSFHNLNRNLKSENIGKHKRILFMIPFSFLFFFFPFLIFISRNEEILYIQHMSEYSRWILPIPSLSFSLLSFLFLVLYIMLAFIIWNRFKNRKSFIENLFSGSIKFNQMIDLAIDYWKSEINEKKKTSAEAWQIKVNNKKFSFQTLLRNYTIQKKLRKIWFSQIAIYCIAVIFLIYFEWSFDLFSWGKPTFLEINSAPEIINIYTLKEIDNLFAYNSLYLICYIVFLSLAFSALESEHISNQSIYHDLYFIISNKSWKEELIMIISLLILFTSMILGICLWFKNLSILLDFGRPHISSISRYFLYLALMILYILFTISFILLIRKFITMISMKKDAKCYNFENIIQYVSIIAGIFLFSTTEFIYKWVNFDVFYSIYILSREFIMVITYFIMFVIFLYVIINIISKISKVKKSKSSLYIDSFIIIFSYIILIQSFQQDLYYIMILIPIPFVIILYIILKLTEPYLNFSIKEDCENCSNIDNFVYRLSQTE